MEIILFKERILNLIEEKREGTYWDFKQEYHKDKAKLLHDIICLANNIDNREAYLIFGVSDSGKIIGIETDENRKNKEQFTSFLRGKKFSGGITPYVILKTLIVQKHEIDVLVIKKSEKVPYYLAEQFKYARTMISAGSIYLRIEDQNTPINATADPLYTEQLWKYRLGLLPIPLKRLEKMLDKKDSWGKNQNGYYFVEAPEFTIIENEERTDSYDRNIAPFYAYNQMNSLISYYHYECKYHNTVLYDIQTICLDSGRYHTPIPEFGFIPIDRNHRNTLDYRYFIRNTTLFYLHLFLFDDSSSEAYHSRRKMLNVIPIFESEKEREYFEQYIELNLTNILEKLNISVEEEEFFDIADDNHRLKKITQRSLSIGQILVSALIDFRLEKEADSCGTKMKL